MYRQISLENNWRVFLSKHGFPCLTYRKSVFFFPLPACDLARETSFLAFSMLWPSISGQLVISQGYIHGWPEEKEKNRICEPGSLRVGLFWILGFDWTGRSSILHTDVRLRVLWVNQRADQSLCFCCRSTSSALSWERKMGEAWRGWRGDLIPLDEYIIHRSKCEDEYIRRAHSLSSSSFPQRRRNVSNLS